VLPSFKNTASIFPDIVYSIFYHLLVISKRKMPFFCIFKGLSNKQIIFHVARTLNLKAYYNLLHNIIIIPCHGERSSAWIYLHWMWSKSYQTINKHLSMTGAKKTNFGAIGISDSPKLVFKHEWYGCLITTRLQECTWTKQRSFQYRSMYMLGTNCL